ncbi:MAG: hypothetical protein JKX78_02960 [Alteromonadaceae bacterium]|nr:hypothetical protein [Alteromonadaceae bacterium]
MTTFNPEVALQAANELDAPASNTASDLLGMVLEMEGKRRKLHRELSQQEYLITPMNGPDQVGEHEVISFKELLEMVQQFNKGQLPHSDDWFTIEDITQKVYPMKTFYQFIK